MQDGEGTHQLQNQQPQNIIGQFERSAQSESGCGSSSVSFTYKHDIGEGRINANIDIGVSHSWQEQPSCRRVVTIVREWGLRDKIRDFRRSSEVSGCKANCGCVCKPTKQKVQKVLQFDGRLLGVKVGRVQAQLEERNSVVTSTNNVDLKSTEQNNEGLSRRCNHTSQLGGTALVARVPECSSQPSSCGKMCRRASPRRSHEKAETASPTRRFVGSKVQGEKGEETFFELARLRGLSDDAINSSVQGWHTAWRRHRQRIGQFIDYWKGRSGSLQDLISHKDPEAEVINYVMHLKQNKASANNIVESVAALSLLFKVSGHTDQQIQGKILQLVMKKYRAALRKTQKEESIYNLDDLLQVLDEQARNIGQISEKTMMGCTIVSIMIFSVLRLAEVMRSEAIKGDNGVWQLSTATWKGGDDGVVVTFRKSKYKNTSPSFWLAAWINGNQKRTQSENLWYLNKTKRVASVEYGSKAVHEIMKLAGIEMTYSVTSIRASSVTKQVKIGATKQQINRMTRHKNGPNTVAKFYDKTLNDGIRERLATFKRHSLINKKELQMDVD
ncbi:MAG: hypothetical protein EZS28_006272 [Streblomastix strix]|uniref:Tyr recombinase domain-containing protein n=1 Tax=Streblomastix strix TaxID=222440 RepID=A0A5J4WV27_9EUKA|nr:MAG: hypothetical protein EZS28_006272 [Streblomastix strix]